MCSSKQWLFSGFHYFEHCYNFSLQEISSQYRFRNITGSFMHNNCISYIADKIRSCPLNVHYEGHFSIFISTFTFLFIYSSALLNVKDKTI